jgi:dUTP pyrophosphatase
MTEMAAGMDLYANVNQNIIIKKNQTALIKTGIKIMLDKNYEAQIRSRSGLALNNSVVVLNSPGTIDADYRGEIGVILINFGDNDFLVKRGNRIAQLVINKIHRVNFIICEESELISSARNEKGFGHTGI